MSNLQSSEIELDLAHIALSELYRGNSVDYPQINRLWHRIETLEAEQND